MALEYLFRIGVFRCLENNFSFAQMEYFFMAMFTALFVECWDLKLFPIRHFRKFMRVLPSCFSLV